MDSKRKKSRTKNTIFNIGSNFIVLVVKTFLMFITRTVFIHCLGSEALGLNGLFTNVLSMLSLAELGIGQAINFSLYKPLSTNDEEKISSFMSFYKRIYRMVGLLVFVIGIMLIPFLKFLINDIESIDSVYFIYLLFLLNTVSSYFISYKETLIIADQKKYKLIKIELLFIIFLSILQSVFLIITKNFILYLIIQFVISLLQRIVTNIYITKKYNYINFNSKTKVAKNDLYTIKKNVKAMFFHKIGDYCINGTDNLIISSFINISMVGIYSNYLTIVALINSFVLTIYNGITASLGNLIASDSLEKRYQVFKKMNFISFLLHGFSFVVLINIFNDFIVLWIGSKYQLDFIIVVSILVSFYLTGMRVPCGIIKSAAGVFDVDKYTPIIQSIINLVISIFLVKKIGLLGVIMGTIISSLVLPSWQRPYVVYKYILKVSSKEYFLNYFVYSFIIMIVSLLSMFVCSYFYIKNLILMIIIKLFVVTILFFTFVYVFYHKSDELKYIINLLRRFVNGKKSS